MQCDIGSTCGNIEIVVVHQNRVHHTGRGDEKGNELSAEKGLDTTFALGLDHRSVVRWSVVSIFANRNPSK